MVLVDAHVHIHECFDIERFLFAMASNFRSVASEHSVGSWVAIACLAECSNADVFKYLRDGARLLNWQTLKTREAESLILRHPIAGDVLLLAGRQIATRERLEVLALGTDASIPDGNDVERTLAAARETGAIVVLPWGFGKWTGSRGRRVHRILKEQSPSDLYVGDNGNRLGAVGEPASFRLARDRGFKFLPGSDPFPFERASGRAGRFGFSMNANVREAHPAADLKTLLRRSNGSDILPFGRLERPLPFLINQLAMQVR